MVVNIKIIVKLKQMSIIHKIYISELIDATKCNIKDSSYFAQLDFIESAELAKEGFESTAREMSDDESDQNDQERPAKRRHISESSSTVSASETEAVTKSDRNSTILNFFPVSLQQNELDNINKTRSFIEKRFTDYVIDGKRQANIGRFLNVCVFF